MGWIQTVHVLSAVKVAWILWKQMCVHITKFPVMFVCFHFCGNYLCTRIYISTCIDRYHTYMTLMSLLLQDCYKCTLAGYFFPLQTYLYAPPAMWNPVLRFYLPVYVEGNTSNYWLNKRLESICLMPIFVFLLHCCSEGHMYLQCRNFIYL